MKTAINLSLNDLTSHLCPSLLKINPSLHCILHSYWPPNKGKNHRRTLIGTTERWRRSLNRGLKGVFTVLF